MKKLIILLSAAAITCSSALAQNPGNYYTLQGGAAGQPSIRISELSDVLFNAAERFSVTPDLPGLFQGTAGQVALQIPAGNSQTISIDFTAKGEIPATGLTYPDGYVYITFYYIYGPASVSGRAKDNNGVWHDMQDWTNLSSTAANGEAFYAGRIAGTFNFMTALELTINASSIGTWLTKIEYHPTNGGQELKPAYVSKSLDNKLFSKFDFANVNNTITASIHPDGSGYFGGKVGIGTATPTANLQINSSTVANRTTGPYQFAITDGSLNRFYIVHDVAATRLSLVSPSGAVESSMEGSESGYTLYSPRSISLQTGQGYTLGYNAGYHLFFISGTEVARITSTGFGIKTTNPAYDLDVNGTAHIANTALFNGTTYFFSPLNYVANGFSDMQNPNAMLNFPGDGSVGISTGASASTRQLTVAAAGNVLIGTTVQQGKLAVNGDIYAKKVKVTQNGWADYVFDKNYALPTLAEVEQYLQQHKHLPDMPSAATVEKEGIDLGDNQATLLKKVEELTLYVIEQNKKIEQQQKRIEALEKKTRKKG